MRGASGNLSLILSSLVTVYTASQACISLYVGREKIVFDALFNLWSTNATRFHVSKELPFYRENPTQHCVWERRRRE